MTQTPLAQQPIPLADDEDVRLVLGRIAESRTIVLTTHEGADGDGTGAELALAHALRRLGKTVTIMHSSPLSRRFLFMDRHADIRVFKPGCVAEIADADLVLLIDTCELRRTGPLGEAIATRTGPTLAIDHHPRNGNSIDGMLRSAFSSTGELMVHVMDLLGVSLSPDIANWLYCAILFDTNQFRFTRNRPEVLETAARLVRAGADAELCGSRMFGTVRPDRLILAGRVLENATFEFDGRFAWATVTLETMSGLKVDSDEVRSMVNVLGDLEGVELAVLFKEFQPGRVKLSLRSRGKATVGDIAERLGGGGHPFAAGVDINDTMEQAQAKALPMLREKLA